MPRVLSENRPHPEPDEGSTFRQRALIFPEDIALLPPIAPFLSPKTILREKLRGERRAAAKARPDAGKHAARLFLDNIPLKDRQVVSLYHPMKDELDVGPLAAALLGRGCALALPVVETKNAPLIFRRYLPGDALGPGSYGERVPDKTAEALTPDILVVPLLGFTRDGGRLGYGAGYYDRTLADLRARRAVLAVGYGFGAQEVDALPLSPLDQPLDWIVTEREAIRARAR